MDERVSVQTASTEKTTINRQWVKGPLFKLLERKRLREFALSEILFIKNGGTEKTILVISTGEAPSLSELSVEKTYL